jgi:pimeloyl-ACP methyl ester carboxylesterase
MADVHVNGVRLYYEEYGRGAPILCIHGTSSSAMVWSGPATDALAKLGRAIVYDRRGCSRSERPVPYETSVAQHAGDAAALIEALGAKPAILIGRSYGGGVAVGVAVSRPDLVRALVLLEPGDIVIDGEKAEWEQRMVQAVEAAAATDPSTVTEAMFRSILGDAQWESLPPEYQEMFAGNSPAVLAEVRGPRLELSSADLGRIGAPTLLVAGETSLAGFRRINAQLAAAIPDSHSVVVGGGHLIAPHEPAVLRFIGEILGRR